MEAKVHNWVLLRFDCQDEKIKLAKTTNVLSDEA